MSQNLGEFLRHRTDRAREARRAQSLESIERHRRMEEAGALDREREIDSFVSRFLDLTITKIGTEAERRAESGKSSSKTIWSFTVDYGGHLPELDIDKHRALRDRAIEKLSTMGVVATSIDRSITQHDTERPFVTEEYIPDPIVGHEIGVSISWEQQEQQ